MQEYAYNTPACTELNIPKKRNFYLYVEKVSKIINPGTQSYKKLFGAYPGQRSRLRNELYPQFPVGLRY